MKILDFIRRLIGVRREPEIQVDLTPVQSVCEIPLAPDPEVMKYMFIEKTLDRMDDGRPKKEWYQAWHRPPNVFYFDINDPFGNKNK